MNILYYLHKYVIYQTDTKSLEGPVPRMISYGIRMEINVSVPRQGDRVVAFVSYAPTIYSATRLGFL
jgi:hypothetical protein